MFRVGDKVTCITHGMGRVISVNDETDIKYPILVDFTTERRDTYTSDGKIDKGLVGRYLFHGHIDRHKVLQDVEVKPVRKVKKYINLYLNPNESLGQFIGSFTYSSRESAFVGACEGVVATAVEIEIDEGNKI